MDLEEDVDRVSLVVKKALIVSCLARELPFRDDHSADPTLNATKQILTLFKPWKLSKDVHLQPT